MYAEWGPGIFLCDYRLLQYMKESFAWKYSAAAKWAQRMHVSALAFKKKPLLVLDTSDNENKEREREYEEEGSTERWGEDEEDSAQITPAEEERKR